MPRRQDRRSVPTRSSKAREKRENIAELYVLKQIREKTPMVVRGYGGVDRGFFVRLSKYHITTYIDGKKKGNEKLELCCYYKQRDEAAVEQVMTFDEEVIAQKLTPIRPRKDRYQVPGSLLAQCRRNAVLMRITLRTGEVFIGQVQWFTPFDIGLMLPTKVKVMLFRHAIYRIEPAPRDS